MSGSYSDDETLELQEDEQQTRGSWATNVSSSETFSSERIRRSCASTDIAALMDTEMDDDSGRDEVEEHEDPLPQRWIEYYRDKFNANNNTRWTPPPLLEDRFRELLDRAVEMCEAGRCDGTVEMFITENLVPLFRKWYYSVEAIEHWPNEIFHDIGDSIFKVARMLRGLLVAGAGSRDIPHPLWDLFLHIAGEMRCNVLVGERIHAMHVDVDESQAAELIKEEHIRNTNPFHKYMCVLVLLFDVKGFEATTKYFQANITSSTSIEDFIKYLKAFRIMAIVLKDDKAYSTFAAFAYAALDRLTRATEEEQSCKAVRGPLEMHALYSLYMSTHLFVNAIPEMQSTPDNILMLYQWRLRFLLKALNEAPFNGRMSAVECMTNMIKEFAQWDHSGARDHMPTLMRWLEEERAVDMLTRDNLHNASYVDRVQRVFEKMLIAGIFMTSDLSTVWEAQRGKHDVIQRNLAELIIRIVPFFDNDLIQALFHKIQAGWVDGGVRERDMLIDIVSKIGINSAFQIGKNQASETDQALVCSSLQTLWTFIRQPGTSRDNEDAARNAHLKLLDECRGMQMYVKEYAEFCSADIQKQGGMAATAASHLVHILELASDDEDEDELDYGSGGSCRFDLIGSLESSHSLVRSLCENIGKSVKSVEDDEGSRKTSLVSFISALTFVLQRNREQLKLSEAHASELWEALISKPVMNYDPSSGFKFFVEIVDSDVMDRPMLERFFNDYVLAVPQATLSLDGYSCFEAFFKAVNEMEGKASDFFKNPDNLLGAEYVRELMLQAPSVVCEHASNLWVEYLQKMIYKEAKPAMTASLVQSLVTLIMAQYATMADTVREARSRGLHPMNNPAYEMTKDRTMRCIKVLSLLVNGMDEEVKVARLSVLAMSNAAIGRPIFVSCKVPRREWETVNYKSRGTLRSEDLDTSLDFHEHTTVADLRDAIKKHLADKLSRRRCDSLDDVVEHFLLVFLAHDGPKKLLFTDYKRTLGEMGMDNVAEVEVRLSRTTSPRQGDVSDSTSTSECDWMSPEEQLDDRRKESILPSRALAADADMIDRLLEVAECEDVDIAMHAFRLLTMVPQNELKHHQLLAAMQDETGLRALLEHTSDSRFLYYLMMLEAIILPAPQNLREDVHLARYSDANNAMMMFIRVLPHVARLDRLMGRSVAFRSLAIMSITHILQLACMTATRVVSTTIYRHNQSMSSSVISLLRLQTVDLPVKWTKHIRVRRMSSIYADNLEDAKGLELVHLVETHSSLALRFLCGVILSASAFQSCSPLAAEHVVVLADLAGSTQPLLDEATMDSDPCTVPALLECAVYSVALLAAACPLQCAEFIGAVSHEPDTVWVHTLVAATFHKADNVRVMSWSLAVAMVEVVRASLKAMHQEHGCFRREVSEHVALTEVVLDLLPRCRGTERFADQFVLLVKECVHRAQAWEADLKRLDEHIRQGVEFLETALLQSNAEQTSFPDETYLRARIEVLRMLMRYTPETTRARLGSRADGPRLCERLLADFIFPAARVADGAGAAAAAETMAMVSEDQLLPRSSTHAEMNSSSSLFELTARDARDALPRSMSALPIACSRRVAVCSGEGSQDGAFNLLLALCDGVPENQILMQQTIHRLFYSNPWTDKKEFDYLPQHVLRGDGDLVGLKNGGATCYMNSIFQQLFMIDEVREAVLNAPIPEKVLLERRTSDSSASQAQADAAAATPNRGEYAVKVLAAVQILFAHLLGSELESYRPAEFWKVFNFKPNGELVNVREQQDAVEFHNMVTELIDEGLKKCGGEAMCERTFRGVFADEKICKDCPHRFTKEEPFESLSLDVRSHNNLRDSLKEYVKGDVLENDNAYHCELCNKKVKAIKRMSLSKAPEVLIVQLKRFDFDWEKEISVKFNDYFEFPFEMDIQPYTLEGLEKLEKGIALENNRDYQYMLRGVVVHSGQAQGGHYTSYIRNRETGKWFKFDDNDVTPWDATENGAQMRWFGCSDSGLDSMGRGRRKMRTTYWNAYMLFYEKIDTANRYLSVNPSSVASDMSTSSGVSSMTTTMNTIISSAVSSTAISASSASPSTPTSSGASTATATAQVTPGAAVSPPLRAPGGEQKPATAAGSGDPSKNRSGKSASPVSNLHRHFSSMSLSSARIRMPPRLEEMLREGNRRVQLERVQYSTHYFSFITSATSKALTTAGLNPTFGERLMLETTKSFASFIVHNALFASRDLMNDDGKCSFIAWISYLEKLLVCAPARLWFITHVLFSHEIAACFLFATDPAVREFFRRIIIHTMALVDDCGDASEACLDKEVTSPVAGQLAQSIRQFPRLSHLLANLLGMLPYKHNSAFKGEPMDFYRTIIDLADKQNMLAAMVRGGILNNLLTLFSPVYVQTDLSSLQRRDPQVYEQIHRVVAAGLRTIRLDPSGEANRYSDKQIVVRRTEITDLKVLGDFLKKDGGHVKFIQQLIELLRRANRSNATELHWVTWGVLWLCHVVPDNTASPIVIDLVCQTMVSSSFYGMMVTDTAMDWLVMLLDGLFAIDDDYTEARFEHLFFKAQLTSTHAHPSVQGLVEYSQVSETRYESLIRVLLSALIKFPDVDAMLERNEPVRRLLSSLNTFAMCKPNSRFCGQLHEWYEKYMARLTAQAEAEARAQVAALAAAAAAATSSDGTTTATESDSMATTTEGGNADSTMDDESKSVGNSNNSERPTGTPAASANFDHIINNSSNYSAGQLSPSSRLNALCIGDKRKMPDEEGDEDDGCPSSADRKRSIGETARGDRVKWSTATAIIPPTVATAATSLTTSSTTTGRIEDRAASPMDDSDLLYSSSTPSTSFGGAGGMPSQPPPAYSPPAYQEVVAGRVAPPPVPPRPAARQIGPTDADEFVEKHKHE